MGLRAAASLGLIQSVISMAAGFASVKVTSVYLGPAGIGVLSQFQYLANVILGFAAGSTNTATVRLTSEYAGDPSRFRLYVGTVARTLLAIGLVVSLSVMIAAPWLATTLLQDPSLAPALVLFGGLYLGGLAHAFVLAIANGAKDFRSVTLINVSTILLTLLLFVVLSPIYGLAGALAAAAITPLVSVVAALFWGRRRVWMPSRPLGGGFSRKELERFLSFFPMTLAFALLPSGSQIWARDLLAAQSGWVDVGLVQGVMRLSDMYLNVFMTILSMYYLPRFAEIRRAQELRRELWRGLAVITPVVIAIGAVLYIARDLLIRIVFTPEFLPMRDLFAWQMSGNVLRVVSWLLGYVLVARASPLSLVLLEIANTSSFVATAAVLIPTRGGAGLTQAYVASMLFATAVHAVWVLLICRRMPRGHA